MSRDNQETYIAEHQPNICQICVLKDGKELFSQEWNGYIKTDCTHIMSATKSVVALLVGIAIDKGLIGGVDDKVLSYFPEYQVKRGEKTIYDVTVKHLLTMRAPYKGKVIRGARSAQAWTGRKPHWISLVEGKGLLASSTTRQFACISSPASYSKLPG